jgi:ribonuclease HI
MAKQKYYVVWKGRNPGIYLSWAECEAQVKGFTGAEYKSFESREMAEAAFRGRYEDYTGKPASQGLWLFTPNPPTLPSLCVDAACSGSPGPLEYRGVLTEGGQQVFRRGPLREGTNNVGEFLAIVHALGWLQEKGLDWPVYSDSENAISWVKEGKCHTKLGRSRANEDLFRLIAQAEEWLDQNHLPANAGAGQIKNKILKWDTAAWGEIPADFGRK